MRHGRISRRIVVGGLGTAGVVDDDRFTARRRST